MQFTERRLPARILNGSSVGNLAVVGGDEGVPQVRSAELILSCMVAIVTAIMLSTSIGPAIVKPLLLDGSLISNGRFAFV